ncbi:dnaJ homolog subfamily C member 14-like [Salvelinus fontinalis]|uniref:dnaJ homolog subfamily C member 14-like n=1 Tax=Salvelinus fontinalis TaxID=8038 RepID=UPI0024866E8F|nr:dnaJ homolog subfamily C member 14-like [Salvelinus fontinalis]XP_055769286.1 dnaJ homolog subfamily C member 14-like [Salvelinus fontinalis]
MEKGVAESEMEEETWTVEAAEESPEELPSGVPTLLSSTSMPGQWEVRGDEETHQPVTKEDMTDHLKATPQDIPTPINQDSGEAEYCGIAEAKEDEVSLKQEGSEHVVREGNEETEGGDEDENGGGGRNEVGREPGMNGESGWKSSGAGGRKGRFRNSGGGVVAASEQNTQATSSSSYLPKGSLSSGGGRHKQARRRNHHHHQGRGRRQTGTQLTLAFRELLSESLSPWCISCIHMVVEIIVSVTHRCGVAVEGAGIALYDLGSQLLNKVTDVPGMKADARRVLERVSCAGTVLVDKSIRSVEWVWQASLTCFGLLCAVVLLGSQWAQFTLVRLGGERGQRWWTAVQDSKVWRRVALLLQRISSWFRRRRGTTTQVPPFTPDSPGGAVRYQPGQELERLLALAQVPEEELDPFIVLGVEAHATEAELKRAYRQLAVQIHPDKNKHPRAGEAFKVLRAAWDIVSNPETRREYELKRMAQTELSKSMNEFLTKLQDDLKEAMNTMMCTKCEGKHRRFEMDREPAVARFCAECNRRHSAEEGDLWAESSLLGLRITYFACMDGKVYDITEWAGCQRIGISPDTHRVPYHISFGSKNNSSSTQRHRTPPGPEHPPPGPTNPADLQDFFNRIFQGGPPPDMAANGGFFPSGPPPHQPSGAGPGPSGPFSPPPPQTGFFMPPGGPRPEPSETWADSGGKPPPRRRRKVRKPFQR